MIREQAVRLRELVRTQFLERRADDPVQVLPPLFEQARVRGLADEPVTEAVLRRRPAPLLDDEVEPLQLRERRTQVLGRDEPLEQRLAEAPSDDGRDRRHLAHVGREAGEPRLQRLLDRGRHRCGVAALDRVARRLLEEERIAARTLGELQGDVVGKFASGRRGCELRRGRRVERLELELAETMAVAPPRRLAELPRAQVRVVAIREQQRDGLVVGELESLFEQLERRLVGEVQVFEDEAHRLLARERAHELDDRLVRLPLHRVAREAVEPLCRVVLEREPEQRSEERVMGVGPTVDGAREVHLQLEPHARLRIGHAEAEARTQQLAQRVVRNVLRVRDALRREEADVLLRSAPHLRNEAALADARLARDRDDRAAAVGEVGHHVVEHDHLAVAADERRDLARLPFPLAGHAEDLARRGLALELDLADRLEVERGLDLLRGGRAHGNTPASGRGLQSRRGVDRVAEGVEPFLGRCAVVGEQDDRPGVDSHAPGELHAVRLADVLCIRAERGLHRERRAYGALRIVVVCARDAEQRVEAVAGELRDGTAEPLHLSDEQARHLVEEELRALRPEPLADRRRIRDVREENRHDATLAFRPGHVADYPVPPQVFARVPSETAGPWTPRSWACSTRLPSGTCAGAKSHSVSRSSRRTAPLAR